jgi:hypothetical protein
MTHCGECGQQFRSREDAKLALFTVGFSYGLTSCHLCPGCWQNFKERGVSGIPNAGQQARADLAAAKNKRQLTV